MPTIRVEYPGEDGQPLTVEYADVDAVLDAAKMLTLVQRGVLKGGLTLDVIVAEFPEGRYVRYETVGDAATATQRMGMPPASTHTMGVTPLATDSASTQALAAAKAPAPGVEEDAEAEAEAPPLMGHGVGMTKVPQRD